MDINLGLLSNQQYVQYIGRLFVCFPRLNNASSTLLTIIFVIVVVEEGFKVSDS